MVDTIHEVAPQETAETETESLIDLGEIIESSGLSEQFIDNAESETEEVAEEEQEAVEETDETLEVSEYSEIEEEKPEDSDGVKKRIGKLVEAKNAALAEVEVLKAELNNVTKSKESPKVVGDDSLEKFSDIENMKQLEDREASAEHLREWLLENPDGGDYTDLAGQDHEVEYEQARKLMVETDRDLRKNIPKVASVLIEKQKQNQIALQTFKWMADQSSTETQEVEKILQNNPNLAKFVKTDPHGLTTIGYAVEGFKAVRANLAKQQAGKQPTAPIVPTAPSRSKRNVVKSKGKAKDALLKKAASGDIDDAASYIESLL
jgi:hypothetical protein